MTKMVAKQTKSFHHKHFHQLQSTEYSLIFGEVLRSILKVLNFCVHHYKQRLILVTDCIVKMVRMVSWHHPAILHNFVSVCVHVNKHLPSIYMQSLLIFLFFNARDYQISNITHQPPIRHFYQRLKAGLCADEISYVLRLLTFQMTFIKSIYVDDVEMKLNDVEMNFGDVENDDENDSENNGGKCIQISSMKNHKVASLRHEISIPKEMAELFVFVALKLHAGLRSEVTSGGIINDLLSQEGVDPKGEDDGNYAMEYFRCSVENLRGLLLLLQGSDGRYKVEVAEVLQMELVSDLEEDFFIDFLPFHVWISDCDVLMSECGFKRLLYDEDQEPRETSCKKRRLDEKLREKYSNLEHYVMEVINAILNYFPMKKKHSGGGGNDGDEDSKNSHSGRSRGAGKLVQLINVRPFLFIIITIIIVIIIYLGNTKTSYLVSIDKLFASYSHILISYYNNFCTFSQQVLTFKHSLKIASLLWKVYQRISRVTLFKDHLISNYTNLLLSLPATFLCCSNPQSIVINEDQARHVDVLKNISCLEKFINEDCVNRIKDPNILSAPFTKHIILSFTSTQLHKLVEEFSKNAPLFLVSLLKHAHLLKDITCQFDDVTWLKKIFDFSLSTNSTDCDGLVDASYDKAFKFLGMSHSTQMTLCLAVATSRVTYSALNAEFKEGVYQSMVECSSKHKDCLISLFKMSQRTSGDEVGSTRSVLSKVIPEWVMQLVPYICSSILTSMYNKNSDLVKDGEIVELMLRSCVSCNELFEGTNIDLTFLTCVPYCQNDRLNANMASTLSYVSSHILKSIKQNSPRLIQQLDSSLKRTFHR